MSIREAVVTNIIDVLKDMNDPKPILVTREPFDVEKLAITQFPAILILSGQETRADTSMRGRTGQIAYTVRAFVRGNELDRKRNEIVERIEETLDADRKRDTGLFSMNTQVTTITPVERLAPLGEVVLTVQVTYKYTTGTT
jgi:hypothetical protein